jgi:hypothetical protein
VSEATVYRLLKDHGLITSPAFILMKAADCFANPTTAPNQLWQIDFTYLKVIGWGCFYLSTVPDDFSRYILCRSGLPQNSLPRSVSTRRSLIVSRQLKAYGHDARLMPARYVRPYAKGQKNDFRDAEAIAEAVLRPTISKRSSNSIALIARVPADDSGAPTRRWLRRAGTCHNATRSPARYERDNASKKCGLLMVSGILRQHSQNVPRNGDWHPNGSPAGQGPAWHRAS